MDLWQRFADGWHDALLAFDRDSRLVALNAPAAALLGATPAELAGRTLRGVAPAAAKILEPLIARAFAEQNVFAGDLRPFANGEAYCLTTQRVTGEEGEPVVALTLRREAHGDSPADEALGAGLESDMRFRSLFDYSPDAMLALTRQGIITGANAAAERLHAFDEADVVGSPAIDLVAPDHRAATGDAFAEAMNGNASTIDISLVRSDGTTFPVLATLIPIVFRGTIAGVHLLARDLTAIRRAERNVAAQTDRLRELYLVAASANSTAENQIAATVDAGCRLLGMTSGALYDAQADRSIATVGEPMPRRLARLALGTDGALGIEDLRGVPYLSEREVGEEPPNAYIGTAIDVAGARYGSLCFAAATPRAEPFIDSDRDLVQLMGALIGSAIERGRFSARLKHLAYNDQLTALPNRAWFTDRLRDELVLAAEGQTRVAVMFLDLDRFKDINDTLGHALGDRMLRLIGDRLIGVVGADGLVARMGGDEYIILIGNHPTPQRLDALAQRVIAVVDQPLIIDGYEQFVTTSVGIAMFPTDGEDADTLIKHADVAMYHAKERGRNTHQFFTPALGTSLSRRIAQEKSLRKALEREEFIVHYQPQFDLESGLLVSLEALVRWQHPRLGLVLPDQFIPNTEMSGLIVGLGDWVLETACTQIRAWQSLVPGLRLAVNLSARQFHQTALAAKIRDALGRSGLQPGQLEVEITESVAMSDAALSVQILEELGGAGVRVAVDDFGTGYSSLGYLRRFPLDCLKIDKSFVRDLEIERDDATIVTTIIAMAHSLGLEVCAEGVETAEQAAFLRAERCDRVQGFYYARPMDSAATTTFLAGRGIRTAVG